MGLERVGLKTFRKPKTSKVELELASQASESRGGSAHVGAGGPRTSELDVGPVVTASGLDLGTLGPVKPSATVEPSLSTFGES